MKGGEVKQSKAKAVESWSHYWDIQSGYVYDESNDDIVQFKEVYSQESNSPDIDGTTVFDHTFIADTQSRYYHLLNKSFLDIQFEIESTGAALTENSDVTYSGGVTTAIDEIELYHNGVQIERIAHQQISTIIRHLTTLPYNKQNKDIFRIDGPKDDTTDYIAGDTAGGTAYRSLNKALMFKKHERKGVTKHIYNARVPLGVMFPVIDQLDFVMSGRFDIVIRLAQPTRDKMLFRAAGVPNCKLTTTRLSLWMASVRPAGNVELALNTYRKTKGHDQYAWTTVRTFEKQFTQNDISWSISQFSTPVQRVYIFARNTGHINNQEKNPYRVSSRFKRAQLSYNGDIQIPRVGYNETEQGLERAYEAYLQCADRDNYSAASVPLTYGDFKRNYRIACFDLSKLPPSVKPLSSIAELKFDGELLTGSFNNDEPPVYTADGTNHTLTAVVQQDAYWDVQFDGDKTITTNVRKN